MHDDACNRCGGGIDADHPTTCWACRYELRTGRSYEADVDAAHKAGQSLADWSSARAATLTRVRQALVQ